MNLNIFNSEHLYTASQQLLADLGITLYSNTEQNNVNFDNINFSEIKNIYFAGMITEINGSPIEKEGYDNLLFYSFELSQKPTRSIIADLCRKVNMSEKGLDRPIALILKYSHFISFAIPERFIYLQEWRQKQGGEKIGKIIILRDINTQETHRGHKDILKRLSENKAKNFNQLHEAWKKVFAIKTMNDEFYEKLAGKYNNSGTLTVEGWYQKCFNDIKIDLTDASRQLNKKIDDELKPQAVIRVIVRLMFIWFMKEKGLIKHDFFTRKFADDLLSHKNAYYNAILQNIFFAVLNKKIEERRFRKHNPKNKYDVDSNDYGIFDVFRFKDFFKDGKADEFLALTKEIPFVNGGLFQCHDYKFKGGGSGLGKYAGENDNKNYTIDGFSENPRDRAIISDDIIFELIDLFDSYIWTIEESTPEEQDIALDPELLGTVFENIIGSYNPESKESARKSSGSYYTPKPIVEYMCRESFKETLKTRLPNLSAEIDDLIDNNEDKLNFPNKNNLLSAITDLKILDPACGSGAFPMGMFNLMVQTIEKLQEHKTTYKNKLDIIQSCIYGIDIQNIAIEISKLRFFISLLVDCPMPQNIADFDVLPNLETKFVVANTLIGIDLTGGGDIFEQNFLEECKKLTQIFTPFTTAKTPTQKAQIKSDFEAEKQRLISLLEQNHFKGDNIEKIRAWDPFNVCYCSPFFDSGIMFGITEGFDVVIGNPPYVLIDNKIYQQYYKNQFSLQSGKIDLYRLFIESSIAKLCKENGVISLITPNTFLTIPSCELLRRYLLNNLFLLSIVNYENKVFDTASVNNVVFVIKKSKKQEYSIEIIYNDAKHYLQKNICLRNSKGEINIFLNDEKQSLIENITNQGLTLGRHELIKMVLGEQPYHNTIHSEEEIKSKFLHSNTQINSSYVIELGGKNILRYGIKKQNDNWLNFDAKLYTKPDFKFFSKERIILREIVSKQLVATYTNEVFLVNKSCYSIISEKSDIDLKFILGILNSKLIGFYVSNIGDKSKQELFPRITMNTLKKIPIPSVSAYQQQPIISLVNQILSVKQENPAANTSGLEREIDLLVYGLYGMTEEEIKIIEN